MTTALSTGKVARLLGVDAKTVNNWIKAGKIPATRLPSGHYRVAADDVSALAPSKATPRIVVLDDPTTLFAMSQRLAYRPPDYTVVDAQAFGELTLANIIANVRGGCIVIYATVDYSAPNLISVPDGNVARAIELLKLRGSESTEHRDHDADPDT